MNNPFATIDTRLNNLELLTLEVLQQLRASQPTVSEVGGIELAQEVLRLSKPRIYALVSERAIPHMKRGNRLTFSRAELVEWVKAGSRKKA